MPYLLKAVGKDHSGIVHNIAHMLAVMGINVEAAETATCHSPKTDSPIFSMNMKLAVPGDLEAEQIRRALAKLCDERKVEITLEAAT